MTGHLGYEKHDPAGRGSGNNRNGMTRKAVLTGVGAVDLAVPRDRGSTFDPVLLINAVPAPLSAMAAEDGLGRGAGPAVPLPGGQRPGRGGNPR